MKRTISAITVISGLLALGFKARAQNPAPPPPNQAPGKVIVSPMGRRGWLGVELNDVTAEKAHALGLPGQYGAIVMKVEPSSPAAKAGLEPNDVILKFAGMRVWSMAQLARWVRGTPPGRPVTLEIWRYGSTRRVTITTGRSPSTESFFGGPQFWGRQPFPSPQVAIPTINIPQFDVRIFEHGGVLGISGDDLTPQLAKFFGVKSGRGVLVREVEAGTPAAKAGLKAGDVIVEFNGRSVGTVMDLRGDLDALPQGNQNVKLIIVRDHAERTLAVVIPLNSSNGANQAEIEWLGANPQDLAQFVQAKKALAEADAQLAIQTAVNVQNQIQKNRAQWQKQIAIVQQQAAAAARKQMDQLKEKMQLMRAQTQGDSTI